jgi:hypothetical protein
MGFLFFHFQNTEILRTLQKASGDSHNAEPIKLLSVPKGALGKRVGIDTSHCFSLTTYLLEREGTAICCK